MLSQGLDNVFEPIAMMRTDHRQHELDEPVGFRSIKRSFRSRMNVHWHEEQLHAVGGSVKPGVEKERVSGEHQ